MITTFLHSIVPGFSNKIVLFSQQQSLVSNTTILNIFNALWINIFNISKTVDMDTFLSFYSSALFSGVCAWFGCYVCRNKSTILQIALCKLVTMLIPVFSLVFVECFGIGEAWILFISILYIQLLLNRNSTSYYRIWFLTIILLSIVAFSSVSYAVVLVLFLFSIYYFIKENNNPINYVIWLWLPSFFGIAFWLNLIAAWASILMLIFILLIYTGLIIWEFRGRIYSWPSKANKWLSVNVMFFVTAGMIIASMVIIFANVFIFYRTYNWKLDVIDYTKFYILKDSMFWGIDTAISKWVSIAINIVLLVGYVGFCVYIWGLRRRNKQEYDQFFIGKLVVFMFFIFLNPLSMHIYSMMNDKGRLFDTSLINTVTVSCLLCYLYKAIYNYKTNE